MMKKHIRILVAAVLVVAMALSFTACGGSSEDNGEVNIYMWSDYISQDVVDQFTEETDRKSVV